MFDFLPRYLYNEMQKNDLVSPARAPQKIASHINKKLTGKKVVLYAAGKHTRELLGFLDKNINIVSIIDDEPTVDSICDIKVINTVKIDSVDFDFVVISSSFFTWHMHYRLLKLGVSSKKIKNYYDFKIDESHYEQYHETLPEITREASKQNILLIVPFENADHITRFSSILKDEYNLYKLYYLNGTFQDKNIYFKHSDSVENALLSLLKYIHDNKNSIDMIVLNGISSIFHIAYFVKKIFPQIKLVISMMDFLTSLGSKHKVVKELEFSKRYDFEKKCEKFMVENADGFLASMSGAWAEKFLFDRNSGSLQIFNCLTKDFFINRKKNVANKPLLCYAGGVLPTGLDKSISSDIKMIKVVKPALESGCRFDIYSTIATTEAQKKTYPDYYELADINADFRLFSFLPIDDLVKNICDADFGVMYYDFSVAKKENILKHHLESVIPTKVFTYMAAGLPILISRELKGTHDFLMDNGVGISVSQKDISSIKSLLDVVDYDKLKSNIDSFQSKFCIENQADKLTNALRQIMDKK